MEQSELPLPQIIKTAEGNYTVFYKNIFIYDRKYPLEKSIEKINQIVINPNTLVIIPSPVLFYGIAELVKSLPESSYILFIENDKNLFNLKDNPEIFTYYNSRGRNYYCTDNPDFLFYLSDIIPSDINFRDVILLPLNKGYYLNRDFYSRCLKTAKNSLKLLYKNRLTLLALGQRWYKNIFLNIPAYINSSDISELKIYKPVVVAGAGESLEKSIPLIRTHRNHFTLIAIDTALNTLFNYDLMPDYIIAMESQLYNLFDFYSFKDSKIPLIADITSYPQTSRIFKGEKYFFTSYFTRSNILEKLKNHSIIPSFIPPLGSVGVTAVYIASIITDSPVFYCGLDFCYIPGKTHARNSPAIISHLLKNIRTGINYNYFMSFIYDLKPVICNNGEKSYTNINLESYANSLTEITALKNNIYSLIPAGIAANRNNIPDNEDIISIIKKTKTSGSRKIKQIPSYHKTDSASALIFLEEELSDIQLIVDYGVSFINSESTCLNKNEFKELIKKHDYLLQDFNENTDLSNSAALKNILLSCYKFTKTIQSVCRIIHHQS